MAIPIISGTAEYLLIPFLFIFAVTFGSLRVADVFKNIKVDAIIAVSLSIFTVFNKSLLSLIWSQLGNVTLFFTVMFFIMFVMKAFGLRSDKDARDKIIVMGAIFFILLSLSYMYNDMMPSIPFVGNGQDVMLLIFVCFIVSFLWLAYKIGAK